jgi:hypothetical protein
MRRFTVKGTKIDKETTEMRTRTVPNFRMDQYDRPTPPPVLEERLVHIMDVHVEEDEGSEERPYVTKVLWLLLQDTATQAIFRSPLTLEDIQSITGMSRQLQGRELYKFADALKNREAPLKLMVDMSNPEVDPSMILARKATARAQQEIDDDLEQLGLPEPRKAAQVSRFQFEPSKAKKIQHRVNNE